MSLATPRIIIVIGTMSTGKTFFGEQLATKLNWPFYEADRFHPAANKEKMRAGIPLTDADREPWLEAIAAEIKKLYAENKPALFTCSALKKKYRDTLRPAGRRGSVLFIHLHAPKATLEHRAHARQHEFMNPNLVQAQLDTLEFPGPDETDVVSINTDAPAEQILEQILTVIN